MKEATVRDPFQPDITSKDAITEVLRRGARRLLAEALEDEVEAHLAQFAEVRDAQGRRAVVRNGYLPERELSTGIGPVAVEQPRVRVRPTKEGVEIPKFTSKLLPPYLRKTRSIEELIPWLYLKGISTDDYQEALAALLGPQAPGLSPSTIVRIKKVWEDEYGEWRRRALPRAGRDVTAPDRPCPAQARLPARATSRRSRPARARD